MIECEHCQGPVHEYGKAGFFCDRCFRPAVVNKWCDECGLNRFTDCCCELECICVLQEAAE